MVKMKKIIKNLALILLISCAGNSISYLKEGTFTISEGRSGSKSWSGDLKFKRYSYLNGMTMIFDVIATDELSSNEFLNWFSGEERKDLDECPYPFFIGLFSGRDFEMDSDDLLSQVIGEDGLILGSYEFMKNFSFHPVYKKNSFNVYRFELVCFQEKKDLEILVPGFKSIKVN
ncbi:MAG: hypothetical protein CME61_06280 [Halobacteriovoraceae bacterium]|nr:hypothetical protein [Halobacteriovoraceae bacterium]|tara:strand:- start:245 stop:766 length:522 start_codon:yes stop_codon:yes gene_type:complete